MLNHQSEAITRFAMPAVASFAPALVAVVPAYDKARISATANGATGGARAWSPPV